jgi:hypothetical protein
MTEQDWQDRCAARFIERGGLDSEEAIYNAQICYEEFCVDSLDNPEYCADESMSYWGGDEG